MEDPFEIPSDQQHFSDFTYGFLIGLVAGALLFAFCGPATVRADEQPPAKTLRWKLSASTSVYITGQPCPSREFGKKYPYIAYAYNSATTQVLPGCFTHSGDDIIIHWQGSPDTDVSNSRVPADYFLIPEKAQRPAKKPAPELKPEVDI